MRLGFESLRELFQCGTRQRAIFQQTRDLPDIFFIVLGVA